MNKPEKLLQAHIDLEVYNNLTKFSEQTGITKKFAVEAAIKFYLESKGSK